MDGGRLLCHEEAEGGDVLVDLLFVHHHPWAGTDVRQEGDQWREQTEVCCHLNSGQGCPWAEHQR